MNTTRRSFLAGSLSMAGLVGCFSPEEIAEWDQSRLEKQFGAGGEYDVGPKNPRIADLNNNDIAFVVDISGSMNGRKITEAKKALGLGIDRLARNDAENESLSTALVYFDSEPYTVVEMSPFNATTMRNEVDNLQSSGGGTAIGRALVYAQQIHNTSSSQGRRYTVLLTDGKNESGEDPTTVIEQINLANEKYGNAPTHLYVIAYDMDSGYFNGLQDLGVVVNNAAQGTLGKTLDTIVKGIVEAPMLEPSPYQRKE